MVLGGGNCQPLFGSKVSLPSSYGNYTPMEDYYNETQDWFTDGADDVTAATDVRTIIRKLFRAADEFSHNKHNMEKACWIGFNHHHVMRGQECLYLDYSRATFMNKYHVYVFPLDEPKTLKSSATCMVNHAHSWEQDPFHLQGSHAACEGGWLRCERHRKDGTWNKVLPNLHQIGDTSVPGKLTDVLRKWGVAPGTPKAIRDSISSKSLRRGAVMELLAHPKSTLSIVAGRSGHSLGNNLDFYDDKTNFVRSLPGGKILAGWNDPHQPVFQPRVEALGDHNKEMVQSLMEELLPRDLDCLRPGGRLASLPKHCLATLLMHHKNVKRDIGDNNRLSRTIVEAARKVGLSDKNFPGLSVEMLLDKWSDIILKNFCLNNMPIKTCDPNLWGIAGNQEVIQSDLHWQASKLSKMETQAESSGRQQQHTNTMILEALNKLNDQFEQLKSRQDNEIVQLQEQHNRVASKLAFLRTPTSSPTKLAPEEAPQVHVQVHQGSRVAAAEVVGTSNKRARIEQPLGDNESATLTQHQSADGATSQRLVVNQSSASNQAPAVVADSSRVRLPTKAESLDQWKQPNITGTGGLVKQMVPTSSQKGITVSDIVLSLLKEGTLQGLPRDTKLRDLDLPRFVTEKSLARNCLDLVDYVLTPEQRKVLAITDPVYNPAMNRNKWYKLLGEISTAVMDQMWRFEKKEPENERTLMKKTAGRNASPAYCGLGQRVTRYKKLIMASLPESQRPKNSVSVDLCSPDKLMTAGTPKGNKSMRSFMVPKKTTLTTTTTTSREEESEAEEEEEESPQDSDPNANNPNANNDFIDVDMGSPTGGVVTQFDTQPRAPTEEELGNLTVNMEEHEPVRRVALHAALEAVANHDKPVDDSSSGSSTPPSEAQLQEYYGYLEYLQRKEQAELDEFD